ncbi:MAG: metalloregulator ArsR/SmtB family transcription factor [Planctomycetota bacterium]|nr:metalloregulator ArsR/SmtB family transcription factor [Planctomycetota bacterium]
MNKLATTNSTSRTPPVSHAPTRATADLTERLAALAEPVRLRLLRLLEREQLSVGEVARVVQMPQSTVSRHLKVLAEANWLTRRAMGTATYYRVAEPDLAPEAAALWRTVREQIGDDATLQEDARRLRSVLAERRSDSLSFFGRVSGEWDAIRTELFGAGFTTAALPALLPPDTVIADLGCGTGNAAERLAPYVKKVIAVDVSSPMLDASRKRLAEFDNVEFVEGDLTDLPLEDASVDAAVCVLVLHHLPQPAAAIAEMRRLLKPGGAAAIIDMYAHDREEYRTTMGHQHLGFSEQDMTRWLEEAGLTDARVAPLRSDPEAKGPGLFVASARAPWNGKERRGRTD